MEYKNAEYGPAVLRVFLGLLFIVPGLGKLMDPTPITGMLGTLGFPAAGFFAWLLLLSEIVFGLAVLLGWKLEWTVWPLVLVLLVATVMVAIPNMNGNPVTVLFHLVGIAGLVSLSLTGPGKYAVGE